MKPYSQIKIGDVYRNTITQSEWYVIDKDDAEKMVKISMLGNAGQLKIEIWKRNTDRIFGFPCVLEGV